MKPAELKKLKKLLSDWETLESDRKIKFGRFEEARERYRKADDLLESVACEFFQFISKLGVNDRIYIEASGKNYCIETFGERVVIRRIEILGRKQSARDREVSP